MVDFGITFTLQIYLDTYVHVKRELDTTLLEMACGFKKQFTIISLVYLT